MQPWLTQNGHFLQLSSPLADDELFLIEFSGQEIISSPYQFSLKMFSSNKKITAKQLLHKPISIILNSSTPRYFHGYVDNFEAGYFDENVRFYYGNIRPTLWFLNYASDCRIFQNKNIIDILKLIFTEFKITHYDFSHLTKVYSPRDYCVQYQETTLNFIHRILAEEGIFYFYQFNKSHAILTFADTTTNLLSYGEIEEHGIRKWQQQYRFYPGAFSQTDFNFETPDINLTSHQQIQPKLTSTQPYAIFNYPGNYQTLAQGKQFAQRNFDKLELTHDFIQGESNYANLSAGYRFSCQSNVNTATNYLLLSIMHYAADNSYLSKQQGNEIYHNLFECIEVNTTVSPPLPIANKPIIMGAQTAIVVGPENEDIHTDHYGRVKIQFHWDRKNKKDEHSSCWVRVAQLLAGQHWGALFLPRIGQEVLVQFLEGNPDRPLIIGSLYNANHLPPFTLPNQQTQSGIRTCSTKNPDQSAYNELRFEDKQGQEEIYLQAQKDFTQLIKNNLTIQIGKQSQIEAQQSLLLKVGNNSILITSEGIFINGNEVNINN